MKKTALILAGSLLLGGCHSVIPSKKIGKFEQDKRIDTGSSFYMIQPKDGHEITFFKGERAENKGSAKEAAGVFFNKFHKKFGSLVRSEQNFPIAQGLEEAKARGDKYLITLDIEEWNDEFYMACTGANGSTKRDSIDISVQIYDVQTGELLNKQRMQNAGCPTILLNIIPIGTMGPKGRFSDSLDTWFKNIK
ncbi:MAG: DUF4823 domain-containing protein [Syntrophomonadaceae bacterium]|jgi:hypothetical protein|nr:DUF4823 domain-containing protein [Syntrophomonadaceae bacterium]